MSSTQQQIQGLLSQYTQSQGVQSRKVIGVGNTVPCSSAQHSSESSTLLSPFSTSRIRPEKSPLPSLERPKKRLKLEGKPPDNEVTENLRSCVCNHKLKEMSCLKNKYRNNLMELFFLQNMGNIMDYYVWCKRPDTKVLQFLKAGKLDSEDEDDWCSEKSITSEFGNDTFSSGNFGTTKSSISSPTSGGLNSIIELNEAKPSVKNVETGAINERTEFSVLSGVTSESCSIDHSGFSAMQQVKSAAGSAVHDSIVGTPEAIVERAKQEAAVVQRVSELRKDGLWSSRRLPKVQEPSRNKAHWDYLLEEMQWLAADFAQERKWKKAGARKIANMIGKYHKEQQQKEMKAEKDEFTKLKRIASNIGKMVKEFWSNIEKVVEFKQQSRLQEKRKKALDLHLSFIVDQTEKYSTWLTEGLGSTTHCSSATLSPSVTSHDGDFEPCGSESDDEETINEEEVFDKNEDNAFEVEELQKEMELPFDELLKTLPKELLDHPASTKIHSESEESFGEESVIKRKRKSSEDFYPSNESSDDEETVEKEEESNPEEDTGEINELQSEGNLPLEELVKKYAAAYDSDFEIPSDSEEDTETESQSCLSESYDEDNDEGKCGMEYLMKDLEDEDSVMRKVADTPGKDLTDIAAAAQSIQPTGYTLETTLVKTPVPFLLKHTLREYQVVGLDWMATMYERRLNGILADEMGLGKTIQTIALLTHLACDKGVWGPHLIVVPTSVMLNWEMEFKKWCPSFKILTYFGNQKERKAKRTGWTKTNAFHVCITSYKLVIQDHQAFRRKKWKYFILDEAQNIKNFKSQRWQTLLNFNSQRRLLLTGTPLQNSLMELWSLMHFLMPNVFQSHREFKEWFANPLTGMIEGSREYNENLVKRLHKVLRPFLLRRLKQDVEKQMPKKYEHVVRCHLSRRQRFLYDDFMSQAKTKETLATGHYMSVINILMQLRKVCNHPNLFDPRPIISPFKMKRLTYTTASIVLGLLLANDPLKVLDLNKVCPCLAELELSLPAFVAHRIRRLQTPQKSIEEIDSQPEPESRPVPLDKPLKISLSSSPLPFNSGRCSPFLPAQHRSGSPIQLTSNVSNGQTNQTSSSLPTSLSCATSTPNSSQQPITVQIQNTPQGTRLMIPSGQLSQLPGYIQIVQTPSGQQIIATSQPPPNQTSSSASVINSSSITTESVPRRTDSIQLPTASTITQKPVMKVPPLTSWENTTVTSSGMKMTAAHQQVISSPEVGLPVQKRVPCSQNSISVVSTRVPNKTVFCSKKLEEKRMKRHNYMVQRIIRNNKYNCELKPVYGSDLFDAVNALNETQDLDHSRWHGLGFIHCHSIYNCNPDRPNVLWKQTKALKSLVHNPLGYLQELKDILERYTFATPTVTAEQIEMRTFHPPPSLVQSQRRIEHVLHSELSPKTACLHRISTNMTVQFPEVRLIQYDCGKLQTLDILLRQLKSGQHRVLIFTQMTKMLDVLESFLNYHGHRYLRLDGTTKVEQRQALMERFNADKRIFVFILSTRSGGLGVNLTGADTVIFYDSDWNPTMDAQAQDRCHRIGQTRDVHIYRLISEKTIEENILKKANQKRLLSDVTIEGGNFTTAFFKQNTIEELFQEPSGLDAFIKEKNESSSSEAPSSKKQEHLTEEKCNTPGSRPSSRASNGNINEDLIEQALGAAEDEGDVQAAKSAKAEQSAELAEFDENIPWDEKEVEQKKENDEVLSRVEQELAMLQKELTPVERYAVTHLEGELAPVQVDELEKAEEEVTLAKEEWELNRLKALKEEEERRAELEEDDMLFTYSWEDANNQVYICDESAEQMPIWAPPTPPQDDNDIYMDQSMCFLYEKNVMPETQLPPVYIKKEHKRVRVDPAVAVTRKHKVRKEEQARVPKSLFDRPVSLLRRDAKLKLKQGFGMRPFKPTAPMLTRPLVDTAPEHPEWLIHEDWALLQAVQNLLELPLGLSTGSPGHIPNWDMVADVVNSSSRVYRAPKQCKNRYENVIVPREEGRILYDVNPRKQKKTKGIYKVYHTKNNRPMKTCQLYAQDNNQALSTLYSLRFDSCKCISSKRTPTMRPTLANPTLKNPKHAAVLGENGINYEQPLTPIQVAQIRADRIAKEKKEQQLQAVQKSQVVQNTTSVANVTQAATVVTQAAHPQLTVVQGQQQLQAVVTGAGTTIVPAASLQKTATVSAVSLTKGLGATGSIVVNTAAGVPANAFATINRKLATGQTVVGSLTTSVVSTAAHVAITSIATTARPTPARTISTSMTVQELNAALVNQVRAQSQAHQSQLLTTTALSQNQLARVSAQGSVQQKLATSTKLTPQHLLMLQRQQQIKQQRSITSLTQIQSQQVSAVAQAVQRPVSTPLITNITGAITQGARLQGTKQALGQTRPRTLTEAEMAVFLRQKGGQPKIQTITGATAQVQQVQVSGQGTVARFSSGQIITGAQQIPTQAGTSGQSVATLVKTVSTQGSSVPSVTIPVSAVSLGISVPQQKSLPGRVTPLQVRQIVGSQKKQTVTAAQLQAHKVATIGSMQIPKTQGTPLIIPQKHSQQQVIVQQLQQLVHQSKSNQGPSNSAAVIATQLVTQAGHTVARLSVPSGSSSVRTVAPPNLSASVAPQTLITQATASNIPPNMPLHTGIVKNIQEVVVSPQKPLSLKNYPPPTIRGLPGTSMNPAQSTVAVQQLQPAKQHTPPPGVQQAVQQVVQHAHMQSQQRQQLQAAGVQAPVTSIQTSTVDAKSAAAYAMKLRNQK